MCIKIHYLDASAAVKLVVREKGSIKLKRYLECPDRSSNLFMTSFCVAETLGVLKKRFLKEWCKELGYPTALRKYWDCCAEFLLQVGRDRLIEVRDIDIGNLETFAKIERFAKKYKLDVIDAFQLVTLNQGFVASLKGTPSECVLITADKQLAKAARDKCLNLRVWNCERGNPP